MSARARGERGAAVIEFALIVPVLFVAIGLAFFTAYVHEVRSDLQRVAQETATYAANQCDPIGRQASGCKERDHPDVAAMTAYAKERFRDTDFAACDTASTERMCVTYRDTDTGDPVDPGVANAQVEVVLHYRENSPFAPFLKIAGFDGLVDLRGRGEAVIE